jgi:aminoglycoside 3-N-acetyltransferase I
MMWLGGDSFIALAALKSGVVVGGIAAYELKRFDRREGIATAGKG